MLATSGGQFGNTDVISSLKKIPPETLERLKKKFQITYFTIKNELPINACKNILKLESLHGVEIGNKYLNDMSLGSLIDYIGNDLKSKLLETLCRAKYFSVLSDRFMDIACRENEVISCLYFDPLPPGSDRVKVNLSFLSVKHVEGGDSKGIVNAISQRFEEVGIGGAHLRSEACGLCFRWYVSE